MKTNLIRLNFNKVLSYFRNLSLKQEGFGLVESLLAVAILGSAVYMFIGGMYTGTVSIGRLEQKNTAENLARTQFEYTKSAGYRIPPHTYQSIDSVPENYAVTSEAYVVPGKDTTIEKIVVTVYRDGTSVYVLEGYKVWR